jgi:phosphomannomutase
MNLDSIFKAYDVRGKVGSELNVESLQIIGKAFGTWLPQDGAVAVGWDMRPDSKELAENLIKGLTEVGRDVVSIGQVTSDMIYFATGKLGLAGGAVITASHNPGEYNGIKFCHEEAKPVGELTGLFEVRDLAKANHFAEPESPGKVTKKEMSEEWANHVLSFIDLSKLKNLRIAVDAGNGMAGKTFPEIEPYIPFEVQEMYFELDGTFPNHIANPVEEKNLVDIKKAVQDNDLDAGIAFDGDGDRAVIIDEKGQPLTGTVITALLAEFFLKKWPGSTILINAICGQAASEAIEKNGGKVIRTRVGHSFIKDDMRTYDAVFAGEPSGHYYFKNNYMADSGLITAMIALAILCEKSQKLSEVAAPYRDAYLQIPETNYTVADKDSVLKAIEDKFSDSQIDKLDGLTVKLGNNSWFNVRASNTEPLLRLNAEAKTREELDKIVSQVSSII